MPLFTSAIDSLDAQSLLMTRLDSFARSTLAFARKFEKMRFVWKFLFSWQDSVEFDRILAELDGLQRDISFALLAEVKEHTTRTTEAAVSILTSELRRLFAGAKVTDFMFDKHLLFGHHLTNDLPPLTESDVVTIRGNIAASRDCVQRDESSAEISPEIVALCDDLVGNVLPQLETQLIDARETGEVADEAHFSGVAASSMLEEWLLSAGILKSGRASTYARMMVNSGISSIDQLRSSVADSADFLESIGIYAEDDVARIVSALRLSDGAAVEMGRLVIKKEDLATGDAISVRNRQIKHVYGDGSVYEGEWENNTPNGLGKMVFPCGEIYEGEFKDGKRNGHGKDVCANGSIYEGEWKDDKRNGRGKLVWADGSIYEGEWKDGSRNGHGKKVANGTIYEGNFKDDKRNGRGKQVWADGSIYEGDFKDGSRNGHGKEVRASGNIYEGEWKDGKHHGHGKEVRASGTIYEGNFKDDKRKGHGKEVRADGSIYEGEWKDDKRNGRGKLVWADGSIYEGEWKDGSRNGHGKKVNANGKVHEGQWKGSEFMG